MFPVCKGGPNPHKNIPQGDTLRDIFYESFFGPFFAKKEQTGIKARH